MNETFLMRLTATTFHAKLKHRPKLQLDGSLRLTGRETVSHPDWRSGNPL
jgi:hypothetical protein